MSYHIIYRKQFVKVSDTVFLAMFESGDNNVYEATYRGQKRSRSWESHRFFTGGKFLFTQEDVLNKLASYRQELIERAKESAEQYKDDSWLYDDKRFGYHAAIAIYGAGGTIGLSFKMFQNLYLNGMKQAMTIEELATYNITLTLRVYRYDEKEILNKGLEIKPDIDIKSTEHLIETAKGYEDYYGDKVLIYFTYSSDWGINKIERERKFENRKKRVEKPKQKIEVDHYYVLGNGIGYYVKGTRRGYRYMNDETSYLVKRFIDEKKAETFRKNMTGGNNWKVVPVFHKTQLYL